jgi:hypothetical protein
MHPWFGQYMHGRLEDFLPDPYVDICKDLAAGKPFAFSRFGDGELAAVFGVEGANSDQQKFHPELGRRLTEILERKPDYLLGLQTLAVLVHGARPILLDFPGIEWVLADSLHNASMEGRLGSFLTALSGREVCLVGAPHHLPMAEERRWRFVEVPYGDCWPQYESILARLDSLAADDDTVFLLCASMTANVLLDDLHTRNPRNTYIDLGSVFDPHVGVKSRDYHHQLDPDPLKGISP